MIRKILLYFTFVIFFILWKPIFMLYHWDVYAPIDLSSWLQVMISGIPHDLTVAGYVMALPFLLTFVRIWIKGKWHMIFMKWYLRIILFPILLILFSDLELYTHWGFRLDATPLIYLTDNPRDALANAPTWTLIVFPILLIGAWWIVQRAFINLYTCVKARRLEVAPRPKLSRGLLYSLVNLILCGLLFIAIRGGVTVSTMNVGKVYFSHDMKLNHAAINPTFSFLASISKSEDFSKLYRFMSDKEAEKALTEMHDLLVAQQLQKRDSISIIYSEQVETLYTADSLSTTNQTPASIPTENWLNTTRPNIILIALESFSGACCQALYQDADPRIMPTINRLYREGIGFTNWYSNSFRTDRGMAAILGSYPAQPTNSIMKQPEKTQNLTYMTRIMRENAGYDLQFIYGGDADFTNMRSFLMAGGIDNIVADVDFPLSQRISKWGVPDHLMFNYLYENIVKQCSLGKQPFMKVFLTLSSHEPFEVPFCRIEDDIYLNSVAYTDSCLGSFIDRLKATPYWNNLLIIGMPDHCFSNCPKGVMIHESLRFHSPMFWTGGAIARPRIIDTYGSQIDLGATLLGQMQLDYSDFTFSKNLADPNVPHFAFYTWSDGFGFLSDTLRYIQDNAADGKPLSGSQDSDRKAETWGKAYLQRLYDDLSQR